MAEQHPQPFQCPSSDTGTEDDLHALGFMTSGGDSPGMNVAIRAIVRTAIHKGLVPYAIHDGYKGLIEGCSKIRRLGWYDVEGISCQGGTIIGSSRAPEFMTEEGKLKAAKNMVEHGISHLVIIGGDGSMTGANIFRERWTELLEELVRRGDINEQQAQKSRFITIAGLCGSIDNDMCGTEKTIGADSSLHRVIESIDAISATAESHRRAFVIEVMGRNCGWLALMAHIALSADWVFLPEDPPRPDKWQEDLCITLKNNRAQGKPLSIVILSEGAVDRDLNPIRSNDIKNTIVERLGYDTRATILGHLQRGGAPSAYDRYLATIQGVDAVSFIAENIHQGIDRDPVLICIEENRLLRKPLMRCVGDTLLVKRALEQKNFDIVLKHRSKEFRMLYAMVQDARFAMKIPKERHAFPIAIVNAGAPAAGMNMATKAVVQTAAINGHATLGIRNGFEGFAEGDMHELGYMQVEQWGSKGGTELGTNRTRVNDSNVGSIAYQLQKNHIAALVVVGGVEAFDSVVFLQQRRRTHPAFCIPITLLSATSTNEVPGTAISIGSDTALNIIQHASDTLEKAASSYRRRAFVIQLHGGFCGFLATLSELITGAIRSYIPEKKIRLHHILEDIQTLKHEFTAYKAQGKLIFITGAGFRESVYTPEVYSRILEKESDGCFDSRVCDIGHLQQGEAPSPMDRTYACRLGSSCVEFIVEHLEKTTATDYSRFLVHKDDASCVVIGNRKSGIAISPVKILLEKQSQEVQNWWEFLRPISAFLSKKNTNHRPISD
eukprot:GHVN01008146.1.p1 GENE.GHVN01008146.1~~GHVN01008146.1.p1  ORF type:complete len:892 (-),score=73.02 GHVN01008146.1:6101-8437(-)